MLPTNTSNENENKSIARIDEGVFEGSSGLKMDKSANVNEIWKKLGIEQGPLSRFIVKFLAQARQYNLSPEATAILIVDITLQATELQRKRADGLNELQALFSKSTAPIVS